MSSNRSLRPWPRRCTTPHEDRGRPGPGRRRARRSTWPSSGLLLLPGWSSSACTKKSPAGNGLPAWQSRRGRRSGSRRRTVEQPAELAPMVQILDAPVPQTVDQQVEVLRPVDTMVPEQVIDVQRAVLRVPQMAEQLVDEPVPSFDDFELVQVGEEEEEEDEHPQVVPGSLLLPFLVVLLFVFSLWWSCLPSPPLGGAVLPPCLLLGGAAWSPPSFDVVLLFFLLLFGGAVFLLLLWVGLFYPPVFCWVVPLGLLLLGMVLRFPISSVGWCCLVFPPSLGWCCCFSFSFWWGCLPSPPLDGAAFPISSGALSFL